jgi:cell division protein FtsB
MRWLKENAAVVVLLVQLGAFCFATGCLWERVNDLQQDIVELKSEVKALREQRVTQYGTAQIDPRRTDPGNR